MSCGVGHRCGLDLVFFWLWCRLATVAPIGHLAWEPPCTEGVGLKRFKKKEKKKELYFTASSRTCLSEQLCFVFKGFPASNIFSIIMKIINPADPLKGNQGLVGVRTSNKKI